MQTLNLVRGDELIEAPGDAPARVITEAWYGHTVGYVARLGLGTAGASPLYDVERTDFLPHVEDRRSRFGNGQRIYEILQPGIYEAESRWHRGQVRRHWFEVDDQGRATLLASRDYAIARLWGFMGGIDALKQARLAAWEQRPSRRGWRRRVDDAVAANARAGLPPLDGTAAQVDYAEVIRADRLHTAEAGSRGRGARSREPEGPGDAFRAGLSALRSITDAEWWITHRRTQTRRLLQAALQWRQEQHERRRVIAARRGES